jgi:hypothetical protein
MDHWASFPDSFSELCELLGKISGGGHGEGSEPETIVMLSGDVHHCYLAEVDLPGDAEGSTRIWQAVCSGYRKDLARREKWAMKLFNSRGGERLARGLSRMARAPQPNVDWRIVHEPTYENQVACLSLEPGSAKILVETTVGSDWRDPELSRVFEEDLLSDGPGN